MTESGLYNLAKDWRSLIADREPTVVIRASDGTPYMEHYPIGHRIRIHHILGSDPQPDPHDHPWNYRSLLLEGSYRETTSAGVQEHRAGDLIIRAAVAAHRLTLNEPAWTIFKYGPYLRTWGYHTPTGWVSHKRYLLG